MLGMSGAASISVHLLQGTVPLVIFVLIPSPPAVQKSDQPLKSKTWIWNNSEVLHWVVVSAAAASIQGIATINMC